MTFRLTIIGRDGGTEYGTGKEAVAAGLDWFIQTGQRTEIHVRGNNINNWFRSSIWNSSLDARIDDYVKAGK